MKFSGQPAAAPSVAPRHTDMSKKTFPKKAMVLAAGLGRRMRPITSTTPKPLIEVGGKALINHILDQAAKAGIEEAVVNVHYLADLMEAHLRRRKVPRIIISDERAQLLDSGGGVKKALPKLGTEPFWIFNSDAFWLEGPRSNLERMAASWDPERMDMLMLLASTSASLGFDGLGDYAMDPAGRLSRRKEREVAPFAYAGVLIVKPDLFTETPDVPFSLNLLFDRTEMAGRLYGIRLDGFWLHVGSPSALSEAELAIAASAR